MSDFQVTEQKFYLGVFFLFCFFFKARDFNKILCYVTFLNGSQINLLSSYLCDCTLKGQRGLPMGIMVASPGTESHTRYIGGQERCCTRELSIWHQTNLG